MTAAVGINDFLMSDFAVHSFIKLELFGVAEMLKDLTVFIGNCNLIVDSKNVICYHWYIHPIVIASEKFAMGYLIASGDIPMQSPGCLPDGYGSGRGRRTYIQ